jgi:hypothetical protein
MGRGFLREVAWQSRGDEKSHLPISGVKIGRFWRFCANLKSLQSRD